MNGAQILAELRTLVPVMQDRAAALDEAEAFPVDDVADLRRMGALAAPLPTEFGGVGAGTEPLAAKVTLELLTTLGQGNLAVGRLVEAHVNAIRLIVHFGTRQQVQTLAKQVLSGDLLGLWVTDAPGAEVVLNNGLLQGRKAPCSGAGYVASALITVATAAGTRLAVAGMGRGERVRPFRGVLPGMRAAINGAVSFDDVPLPPEALIGGDGDYLREPDFSTGAWRTTAVTLGGLQSLVHATRRELQRKGHQTAPLQQERFGRLLIAVETARLWTEAAASYGECQTGAIADRVAYVNLARIAVEAACLGSIQIVQRALGLGSLLRPSPVERISRDLAVYLRQPAPDAVLLEAAQHGFNSAPERG